MVARRGISAALLAAALVGCKKPPPPPVVDAGPPPDHLAKDEIPEGHEKAFALPLPMSSRVQYRMSDVVAIDSTLSTEELSNYVRTHVQTTKITAGANGTTFDEAVVATEPRRLLHIEVRRGERARHARSSMLVRDVTPIPAPPKISDEDSWRKAGRTPDGKPLDPKQMF